MAVTTSRSESATAFKPALFMVSVGTFNLFTVSSFSNTCRVKVLEAGSLYIISAISSIVVALSYDSIHFDILFLKQELALLSLRRTVLCDLLVLRMTTVVLICPVVFCPVLFYPVLFYPVLFYPVRYCSVKYFSVQYCSFKNYIFH